ncbi:sensor histidine kinase KdpD [Pelomonas sp. KK5]|uniref:sensor histidine kinase n=1 Tax=Pelomonas sp. KK5 TaxID=1855730 RepID=UPI0009FB4254|nr:HAMP domain-containing sensor histidine kinase [Pelomonas sp. KK5]
MNDDTQVELLQSQLAALQEELDETNRGVVALYAELDVQAEQLRRATELKSRFLAYMSHEFRTPITSMQSLSRLLLDEVDGPLSAEQRRQVGFIASTSAEFSQMVDDLLDLAKVEAGRVEISPAWFEMVDLFAALRGMFKPLLQNPDVTLIFEDSSFAGPLYTDDRKLSQILRNFISNALKFTVSGEVRVSAVQDGDFVVFAVADSGIGIAPELQPLIFQDFTQLHSPLQKRLRGTGLGLSLSKQLAVLLGGSVTLDSVPDKGSVFSVRVPIRLAEATTPPPKKDKPSSSSSTTTGPS